MKYKGIITTLMASMAFTTVFADYYTVKSPDGSITLRVSNDSVLSYSVSLGAKTMIAPSPMGFSFKGETDMRGRFTVTNPPKVVEGTESWKPVVASKHSSCSVPYRELVLSLKEKGKQHRRMDVTFRVTDDAVAFRYTLYGIPVLGNRQVTRELTGYSVPEGSNLWIPNFAYEDNGRSYKSSQEGEFVKTPVTKIGWDKHCGLPGLIRVDEKDWMAITEADLDNWPAFYLGRVDAPKDGCQLLTTKLTPIWGEKEDGVKARFSEEQSTSWRVILIGHNPGKFIESETIKSLNPDCKIKDTSWIKPGMSAWDHWWSGEVKMEMPVIKQYIDLASREGWPYMLVDWTWYGPYNTPEADITKPAPQLDMKEIIDYARQKNVGIWLWLRCEDANNNDQYKKAFPLYHKWGVKGVKIDFMDRDDQDMVNWYRRIVKAAAENELMVDFHGAYKPDGIERTWPNLLTREGVMGGEYYNFSDRVTPEHNVTLAYTRMLAGPMDYTPGGFLNVTKKQFRQQSPTLVSDTRATELAKFVVYDSPFMVFADHPEHVYGQTGEDFLRAVPTVWDDIRFLGGDPESYVALAKRNGDRWFIGVINNSQPREIKLDLRFLGKGKFVMRSWTDGKKADTEANDCVEKIMELKNPYMIKVHMAGAGGFAAIVSME